MPTANQKRTRTTKTEDTPVLELVTLDDAEAEDIPFYEQREPLFVRGGVTYEARINFSATEVLEYARIARTKGVDTAIEWVMDAALGPEGVEAFNSYKYMRREVSSKIVQQVMDRLLGGLDPK